MSNSASRSPIDQDEAKQRLPVTAGKQPIPNNIALDKLVSVVAGLGVPGIVLVVTMTSTGLTGAASITAALALLGPGGMIGGITTLGVITLITKGTAEYGVDALLIRVIKKRIRQGDSIESILEEIEKYPISRTLKLKVKNELEKMRSSL